MNKHEKVRLGGPHPPGTEAKGADVIGRAGTQVQLTAGQPRQMGDSPAGGLGYPPHPFTAQVSYTDPDTEWNSKHADLERSEEVPIEVSIKFERGNHLNYEVTAVKVNRESVSIYVDEDAKTHWK